MCETLSSDRAIVKLILARRAPYKTAAKRAGRLLCNLAAGGYLSPSLLSQKDVCSELMHHAKMDEICREEAIWAIAVLAGRQEIAAILVNREDVIKMLLAATEDSAAICFQVPTPFVHCISSYASLHSTIVALSPHRTPIRCWRLYLAEHHTFIPPPRLNLRCILENHLSHLTSYSRHLTSPTPSASTSHITHHI